MFYSSRENKPVSLAQYEAGMVEQEQKYIYYACGDSTARLDRLPQAEPVREKGYAILYLTDEVDEFVMNMLGTYNEKELKNVNSDDLGIEAEDTDRTEQLEKANEEMFAFIKECLGDAVAAVKLSKKLKSSPVCLGTQGEITLEMEKYFAALPGSEGKIKAERVLELNPSHPVFEALARAYASDRDKAARYARLLHFQALLYAGMEISDPGEYSELICELMI